MARYKEITVLGLDGEGYEVFRQTDLHNTISEAKKYAKSITDPHHPCNSSGPFEESHLAGGLAKVQVIGDDDVLEEYFAPLSRSCENAMELICEIAANQNSDPDEIAIALDRVIDIARDAVSFYGKSASPEIKKALHAIYNLPANRNSDADVMADALTKAVALARPFVQLHETSESESTDFDPISYHITGYHNPREADAEDRKEPCTTVSIPCGAEALQIAVYGHGLSDDDAIEAAFEHLQTVSPEWTTDWEAAKESAIAEQQRRGVRV